MAKYPFKQTIPKKNSEFPTPTIPVPINKDFPIFSFKYFEHGHGRFGKEAIKTKEDWQEMIHGLHKISQFPWGEIKENRRIFHAHEISKTNRHRPRFIEVMPQILKENPPFQFKSHHECRVVGFFDNKAVFQIIWIDRNHEIYS